MLSFFSFFQGKIVFLGSKIQSHAFESKRIRYNVEQCRGGEASTQGNVEMSGISGIAKPNFPLQDTNLEILGKIF